MEQQLNKKASKQISDEDILFLYSEGYSASIISKTYGINPAYITKTLRNAGLKSRDYRSCPDYIKDVLRELIFAGFTYLEISKKTHIAFNYIREYVRRSEEMKARSKELFQRKSNQAVPPSIPHASVCSEQMISDFCNDYSNGILGFCFLMKKSNANEQQIAYLFSIIDDEMLNKHNQKLESYILSEFKSGIPVIGISKKTGVSPAYVVSVVENNIK